ncbi:3-deoxy-manno-octulosonate cytidylyltransferase, partial [bacterium]|nr:3-deoxy-manno-octulosonate cytidylyltransferase [bacterium]
MKAIGVIPARYGSTRFPGKPLADILGKPMIQYVWERASRAKTLEKVIITTDDERILKKAKEFGAEAVLTSPSLSSGTERVAEAAKGLEVDIVANIQGDEPLIEPQAIDEAIKSLIDNPKIPVATLAYRMIKKKEIKDPNVVKVVLDKDNFALYFSRAPIPFSRIQDPGSWITVYKHLGLYIYRKEFLLKLAKMNPSSLEKIEGLEQLRVLENGYRIKVVETEYDSVGVDTPEDLEKVKAMIRG